MEEKAQSNFCFEFILNGYHLNGQDRCLICNESKELSEVKIKNKLYQKDKIIEQIQKQVMEDIKITDINPSVPLVQNLDPDDYLQLYEFYKNCPCCKGLVYNCSGDICQHLGKCYCLGKDEQDQQIDQ